MALAVGSFEFQIAIEKHSRVPLGVFRWFKIFVLGSFLNQVVNQSGNAYRGVVLKTDYGLSLKHYVSAFMFILWVELSTTILSAALLVILLGDRLQIRNLFLGWILFALGIFLVASPYLIPKKPLQAFSQTSRVGWYLQKVFEFLETVVNTCKDKALVCKVVSLALVGVALMGCRIHVAFQLIGHSLDLVSVLLLTVTLKLTQTVSFTPGNIGLREAALTYVARQAGVGIAQGLIASLVLRVSSFLVMSVCALLFGGLRLLNSIGEKSGETS